MKHIRNSTYRFSKKWRPGVEILEYDEKSSTCVLRLDGWAIVANLGVSGIRRNGSLTQVKFKHGVMVVGSKHILEELFHTDLFLRRKDKG